MEEQILLADKQVNIIETHAENTELLGGKSLLELNVFFYNIK